MEIITPNIDIVHTPNITSPVDWLVKGTVGAANSMFCPVVACGKIAEFTVRFSDDAEVQDLNNRFRGKDKPTNVLSFPNEDNVGDEVYLGDIIISCDTLEKEALEQNKSVEQHLQHLLIHGILHICGFDHIDDVEAEIMEDAEVRVLTKLGIKNPYLLED